MIHKSCHEVAKTNVYFYASSESVVDIVFVHHLLELQVPKTVLCTGVKNTSFIAHCISFTYKNEKYPQHIPLSPLNLIFNFLIYCSKECLSHIIIESSQISKWLVIVLMLLFILNANIFGPSFPKSFNFPHEAFCYLCGKLDKEIIKETKLSRVRLLWWPDLSMEKVRFDNHQFTNIHLSTMDNLKEFRDILGKVLVLVLKKS